MPEYVRYDRDAESGIATIALNRPDKLNALNADMVAQFTGYVDEAERNPTVRSVLIAGDGRAFCAGEEPAVTPAPGAAPTGSDDPAASLPISSPIPARLMRCPKPTVVALQGSALGAGLDIALACDFRIAEVSCRLGDWHVLRGIIPGASLYLLPR